MEIETSAKRYLNNEETFSKSSWRLWFAGAALLWTALLFWGYPLPHVDDIFFAGAGVSLAKEEGLKNPWLKPFLSQFGTDKFYVQTTFHAYLLGWWLKIFGISTKAILSFQCLVNFASSFLLVTLLKRAGFTGMMLAGSLFYFVLFSLSCGLRPELFGLLCILGAVRLWLEKTIWTWFAGCFLGACAPLFAPFLFSVVVPIGLAWLFSKNPNKKNSMFLSVKIILSLAAALLAFVLLAFSVRFELFEYIKTMSLHAAWRLPQGMDKIKILRDQAFLGYAPIFKVPACLFPYFAMAVWLVQEKSKANPQRFLAGIFVLLCFTVLATLSYTQQIAKYLPILSLLAGGFMLVNWPSKNSRGILHAAWFFVLGVTITPLLLYESFRGFQIQTPSLETKTRIIKQIDHAGKTVLLDEYAIRLFYDFRPPQNTLDWLHCRAPRSLVSLLQDKPASAAWLVDTKKLALYVPDSGVVLRPLVFFGRNLFSFSSNQSEIHYFP